MKLALVSDPNTENGLAGIKYVLDAQGSSSKHIGYIASQPDPARDYYIPTQHMYSKLGDRLDCYLELESGFNEVSLKQLLACDAIHLSGVYFCGDNTSLVIIDGDLVELGEPFSWVMN
ncbi:hypothetical protein FM037_12090 [Shewanella psychropiezotolerans]|uniref:Uncharacterized protein n=1 Tax=Shewanella psychropiezotolerans TaxID=2593655 RepID=A0ABX5WXM2_9GAMM|nr:hypothetical protein [Shewanella psychropiezotolerans]QDO83843.1 hypothetical protein FM037_12090 [Shewanella psychropiezotolerans]